MNYCVNCKWSVVGDGGIPFAKCSNPKTQKTDTVSLVSGQIDPDLFYMCKTERSQNTSEVYPCGKSGALFEPKDTQ